jgi:hypothetical protein
MSVISPARREVLDEREVLMHGLDAGVPGSPPDLKGSPL